MAKHEHGGPAPAWHNGPPEGADPIGDWPITEVARQCIWYADDLSYSSRLVLIRLLESADGYGEAASVTLAWLGARCGMSPSTARRAGQAAQPWLEIKLNEGHEIPNHGFANLFNVIPPKEAVERVRELAHSGEITLRYPAAPDQPTPHTRGQGRALWLDIGVSDQPGRQIATPGGVSDCNPAPESPVNTRGVKLTGVSDCKAYSLSHKEREDEGHAPSASSSSTYQKSQTQALPQSKKGRSARNGNAAPHFNGRGFVMPFRGDYYVIEQKILDIWKVKYPEIDLATKVPALAGSYLHGKGRLNHPNTPAAWFEDKIAEDASKVRREKARAKNRSKRGELDLDKV